MRFCVLISILCLLASPVTPQWLEQPIVLRDSLGYVGWSKCIAYNSVNNRVYVAGGYPARLLVINGETHEVVASLALDADPIALCYNSVGNKVYCASWGDRVFVTVVDGSTNQPVKRILIRSYSMSTELCHDPSDNKLYVGTTSDTLFVLDAVGDSLLRAIPLGLGRANTAALCFNALRGKLYCTKQGYDTNLVVLNAENDSVVARLYSGGDPMALCYDPTDDKVYCSNFGTDIVSVIDGNTNLIVRQLHVANGPEALCYSQRLNRLFVGCDWMWSWVDVYDCSRDSFLAAVEMPDNLDAVAYNPMNNKLYTSHTNSSEYDSVCVTDCASNAVIKRFAFAGSPTPSAFVWNPYQNRMYVLASSDDSLLYVIRDSMEGIVDRTTIGPSGSMPATVVRGVLLLPSASSIKHDASTTLFDITGRNVLDLRPGANDVSWLSPGVYFVREAGLGTRGERPRKIVIAE